MKKPKFFITLLIALITFSSCKKKIYGCMDETALNYSPVATNDGQDCIYAEEEEVVVSNTVLNNAWQTWGNQLGITITWEAITQDVLDNGAVSVFLRFSGDSEWYPLPFSLASGYVDVTNSYYVAYTLGQLDVVIEADDNFLPDSHPNADIKVVIFN